jgi:heat-inducible transcriptional repressor
MVDLTGRQIQILRAIVERFIETAEPVGSETIDKQFNFGVSPATIRNEMVYLADNGYLRKVHSSSGRIPTSLAIKFYVRELMRERDLSVADEVSVKERIWSNRGQMNDLLWESARVMAERSRCVGLVMETDNDRMFHSGYAHLLNFPEFSNIDVTRTVLTLLEEVRAMREIIDFGRSDEAVQLVLGEDLGNEYLAPVSFVFTEIRVANDLITLGVIGPARLDYPYVIPMIKYFRSLIYELIG